METGAAPGGLTTGGFSSASSLPQTFFPEPILAGSDPVSSYSMMLTGSTSVTVPQTIGVSSNLSSSSLASSLTSSPVMPSSDGRSMTASPAMSAASMGASSTSMPNSIMHSQPGLSDKLCLVCGDEALGRHFGVLTCEACKSFFRRSVRQSAQYFCRYNRNCFVQKQSRNKCQYCRYQKCIGVGMQIEAVQEERNPTNLKPRIGPTSMMPPAMYPVGGTPPAHFPGQGGNLPGTALPSTMVDSPGGTSSAAVIPQSTPVSQRCITLPMLLQAERAWPNEQPIQMTSAAQGFDDILKSTKDQLYFAIEWAKMVPPFVDLPLEDQVIVLKCVWNELLTLRLAFRPSPVEDALVLGTGQLLYRNQGDNDIRRLVGRFLDEIVTPCKSMSLEMAELVCMKALVLFNPDCPKLRSRARVETIQEQCMELLNEYCRARFPNQKLRFSKILLRLSAVRSITTETRDYLVQQKSQGNTNIDSFVLEMLDG